MKRGFVRAMAIAALLVVGVWQRQPASASSRPPPEVKPTDVGDCSAEQLSEWRFVRDSQLGVQARALNGADWVGMTSATDGFHDWAPLDDFKTTICGKLSRFGLFEPNRTSPVLRLLPEIPEHDWNLIVVPKPRSLFDERFILARRLMERGHISDLESCDGQPCFEAEVTPPPALLKANSERSWLGDMRRGQSLCTFGPWVGDGGHGYRPEIHPAERIWYCDGPRFELLAVQDASQRFADHRQFLWSSSKEPKQWRPWAGPGIDGEFRLAFEIHRGGVAEFRVDQALDGHTRGVPEPIGTTTPTFVLRQEGAQVGEVHVRLGVAAHAERLELDPSRLSVAVTDVCRRGDGRLQGFLSLRDRIGYAYQDGEGFDVFHVLQVGQSCSQEPSTPADVAVPENLRLAVHVVEQEIDVLPAAGDSAELLQLMLRAATEGESALQPQAAGEPPIGDVLSKAALTPPQLRVSTARRFRLSARPHYDGPREEALEKAVDSADATRLMRLLKAMAAPVPAAVKWSIELLDVNNGVEKPGDCAPGIKPRLLERDECLIEIPAGMESTHVVRVTASVTLVDSAGRQLPSEQLVGPSGAGMERQSKPPTVAEEQIRLLSHFIRMSSAAERQRMLEWLGTAVAVADVPSACSSPTEVVPPLVKAAVDPVEATSQDGEARIYRRGYYARMLRHGLMLAAADHQLTFDELNQFVVLARGYASPPCLNLVREMKSAK